MDKNKQNYSENKKRKIFSSIVNKTGKRLTFLKGMEKKYCAEFLDMNNHCENGDNCHFVHALFPGGFSVNDKALMLKHVQDTEGLSFRDKNVS